MDRQTLVRGAGGAALTGGTLRGVTTFLPASQNLATHLTYLAVDLSLLLAVTGLFAFQRKRAGTWAALGPLGALVAILGAALLISDDLFSPAFALYPIAAVVFALGLGALALSAWRARSLPRSISATWLAAIAGGALGLGVAPLHLLFTLAGLLIAVGFVGVGLFLVFSPDRVAGKKTAGG